MARTDRSAGIARLHLALAKTPTLKDPSPARDHLWLVVRDVVCTQGRMQARPFGSKADQEIGDEDDRQNELVAAMTWLAKHERQARKLAPRMLFDQLRSVAVRGRWGSARLAQSDRLHGLTCVPATSGHLDFVHAEVA